MLFARLSAPCFDLCWIQLDKKALALVPGGGGASKTGVKNMIHVVELRKEGFVFQDHIETDKDGHSHLCTAIAYETLPNGGVICAAADRECLVFSAHFPENSVTLATSLKVQFTADPKEGGCVNCCAITPHSNIITAGDDGVCRIWKLVIEDKHPWIVLPSKELIGHKGPVMSLSLHPLEPLLCSASKDGTIRLWNLSTFKQEDELKCSDGLSVGSAGANNQLQLECRGCCFTPDGTQLFSIQSGKRGSATLVRWQLAIESSVSNDAKKPSSHLKIKPLSALVVSKVPCTRLKTSWSGESIVVGASDGSLVLVDASHLVALKLVKNVPCHDLPVTGLSFAPPVALKQSGFDHAVVSCSADYSLAMVPFSGYSSNQKQFIVLISVFVFLLLFALTLGLMSDHSLLKYLFVA